MTFPFDPARPVGDVDLTPLLGRPERAMAHQGIAEIVRGRRALVTGAGGSIGTHLAEFLARLEPERLILVENHEPSMYRLGERLSTLPARVNPRYVLGDVRDFSRMARILREEKPDLVFSLAAYKHVPLGEQNADQLLSVNVEATLRLARLTLDQGVSAFVYPSTDKAVMPPSIYGASKRVAELLLSALSERSSTTIGIARLVNVGGTQGSVIERFGRQLRSGQPLTLIDRMTRYWISIAEAMALMVHAAGLPPPGGTVMVDCGEAIPIAETARRLHEILRVDQPPRFVTIDPRPGERFDELLTYHHERARPIGPDGLLMIETGEPLADPTGFLELVERLIADAPELTSPAIKTALFDLARGTVPV